MASWSQPACRLTLDLIQTIKMFKHVALILAVALNKGLKLNVKKSMILMNILRGPRVYVVRLLYCSKEMGFLIQDPS